MIHVWDYCGEMEKIFNYFCGYIIFRIHQKKDKWGIILGDFKKGFWLHVTNCPKPKLLDIKPTKDGYIPFATNFSQEFLPTHYWNSWELSQFITYLMFKISWVM